MTSKLADIGGQFQSRFKFLDGSKFFGQLLNIPPQPKIAGFIAARRLLRVRSQSRVKPTDVIIAENVKYIVAEHGEGSYGGPLYNQFKLFEVTDVLAWNQPVVTVNTVTGVEQFTRTASQGDVYLSLQTAPSVTDKLGVDQVTRIAACNKVVAVDDAIGPYIVMHTYQAFGVTVVHLRLP